MIVMVLVKPPTIQQTMDEGYIVASNWQVGSGESAESYFWVLKLDSSGDVIWQKAYGGLVSFSTIGSVQQTADGGYIVGGVPTPLVLVIRISGC